MMLLVRSADITTWNIIPQKLACSKPDFYYDFAVAHVEHVSLNEVFGELLCSSLSKNV